MKKLIILIALVFLATPIVELAAAGQAWYSSQARGRKVLAKSKEKEKAAWRQLETEMLQQDKTWGSPRRGTEPKPR
ncbi:hypothetical protein ACFL2Q_18470 [Thermodesulfobacteriota bacterium]